MSFIDSGSGSSFDDGGISFEGSGFPRAGSADASGFSPDGSAKGSSLFGGASAGSLLGAGVAGGGLLASFLNRGKTDPNQSAIQGEAGGLQTEGASLVTQGQGLQQYLTQGTLPPALQAKVDQDTAANKARVIQNAGTTGSSTDARQNSALTQDLANADRSGTIAAADYEMKLAQVGQQMIDQGLKATGMSGDLYKSLYSFDQKENSDLMSSISSFAGALAKIAPVAIAAL